MWLVDVGWYCPCQRGLQPFPFLGEGQCFVNPWNCQGWSPRQFFGITQALAFPTVWTGQVGMHVCMYLYLSQSIQDTDCAIATDTWQYEEQLKAILSAKSRSASAEHSEFSRYPSHNSHCTCLSILSHYKHARQDSAMLAFVICSTWPRPLQPLCRVMGGDVPCTAKPSFPCQFQSTQLQTMQGTNKLCSMRRYTRMVLCSAPLPRHLDAQLVTVSP